MKTRAAVAVASGRSPELLDLDLASVRRLEHFMCLDALGSCALRLNPMPGSASSMTDYLRSTAARRPSVARLLICWLLLA